MFTDQQVHLHVLQDSPRLPLNLHNIVKAVLALTPHRRVHNQIIDYENIVIYI